MTAEYEPKKQKNWWVYIILGFYSFISIMPVVWIVLTAFKSREDAFAVPPVWIFKPKLEAFYSIIIEDKMYVYFFNSAICAVCATVIAVAIGMFAAYAFARFRFPGKDDLAFFILSQRMFPPVALILPLFIVFTTLGMTENRFGLILLYATSQLPFVVWMLRGYFEDIPKQYEEAALVDGDTWWMSFRKVTLPLMAPSLTATSIFVLFMLWNEFAFALYLTGTKTRTLPPSVMVFINESTVNFAELGAACVFIAFPMLFFVLLVQKQFVRGLSMGMQK
jgi:multiple sugar transport system permease protein